MCSAWRFCFVVYLLLSPRGMTILPTLVSSLEELNGAFVLLGLLARREGAQVPALAGLRVLLARIEPVLARFDFADHRSLHRGARNATPVCNKANKVQIACRGAPCLMNATRCARSAWRPTFTTARKRSRPGSTSRSPAAAYRQRWCTPSDTSRPPPLTPARR